jgi:ABC-2 type transport system permease protein
MTQVLQFVTVCFFISAFVLRFAFPAFSTERRTAWILASAPLKPGRIFWIKLAFYLVVFALLGGLVAYVNVSALGLSIGLSALTLTLFFTAVIFITVLGVSLGALFPNFETDDPAMLSTSLPGLAFIVISLAYAALGAFMLFIILTRGLSLPTVIFELATVFAVAVLLYAAPRALERIDYIKSVG